MNVNHYHCGCFYFILWLCCLSCSDDDPGNIIPDDENLSENFPDFSFLTTTPEGIQRYVFDVAEQTGSLINLSEQNEVDPIIARSYVAGRVVGLYVQDRVWLVNMETGSVVMGQNMFPLADEVISNWAVNTDETVYIGFHTDGTFEDFNGFAQNVVTLEQEQFPVGNIGQSVEPTQCFFPEILLPGVSLTSKMICMYSLLKDVIIVLISRI